MYCVATFLLVNIFCYMQDDRRNLFRQSELPHLAPDTVSYILEYDTAHCQPNIKVEGCRDKSGIVLSDTLEGSPCHIEQHVHVKDEKTNVLQKDVGVTNSTSLYKLSDYDKDLYEFKRGIHCSQEVVVSFLNKEMMQQRHDCFTVVEINKKMLIDLFEHSSLISLKKRPIKKNVLEFFKEKNVTSKRCLVRCMSIIHGLALAEKWRKILEDVEPKKVNNVFSNLQRHDRLAGRNLVLEYKSQHNLSKGYNFGDIEAGAKVSFDIYDKEGFLSYSSRQTTLKHTVFYECGDEVYFVKEKYLNAFGKIVTPKKKASKKLKRL